ncbi:MAG: GNAT family N-acetyltransferase [Myxococcota bacterium]|nr:GNAT family N-acetyltransferase [Myxococcota bacterium]
MRDVGSERAIACVAKRDGKGVGLAFVEDVGGLGPTLRSVYVAPTHRQCGVATQLVATAESLSAEHGWTSLRTVFMEGPGNRTDLRRLLARCDWTKPVLRTRVIQIALEEILHASWTQRRRPLPDAFEVFPWTDLSDPEKETLLRDQKEHNWPDIEIFPFHYGPHFEEKTSFGVRYEGKVVGWVVNHRLDKETLRFTCSYLREDLQKLGRLVELYARSVDQIKNRTAFKQAIMTVPVEYPAMWAFSRRHLVPFAQQVKKTYGSTKELVSR